MCTARMSAVEVLDPRFADVAAGAGALAFARKMGFKEQDLLTPAAKAKWEALKGKTDFWRDHDTAPVAPEGAPDGP